LSDGIIKFQNKVWIGNNSALQTKLINSFHASDLGGHSDIQDTHNRLKKLFFWKTMRQDVDSFVKQCSICQQAKHELCKYPRLLQPLSVPKQSWTDLSMDFIEGLPLSTGHSVILVVVDRFTKYSHFFPLKHPYSAASVAQVFLDNIVKLHGIPQSIISDRDRMMWQGRRGVCRGESRVACLLECRLYGGSELALLMSSVEELGTRATEGSSPVGNLLPPMIIQ
jgi:hypothetical protein